LIEGLLVEDTVHCPWHHACFNLRTGETTRPPALNPLSCWRVERQGSVVYFREKRDVTPIAPSPATPGASRSIIILGGIVRLADS
jgi:hypothetical protein